LKSLQPLYWLPSFDKELDNEAFIFELTPQEQQNTTKTNQPDCERPDGTSMPQQSSETEYLGHWINQLKTVTKKKEVIQI